MSETIERSTLPGDDYAPAYGPATLAGLAAWLLYVVTLAPSTAFWDTSEYIATAHIVGIPHPPGNPLFVVVAKVWTLLLAPLGLPVAVRVNLLAATTSAAARTPAAHQACRCSTAIQRSLSTRVFDLSDRPHMGVFIVPRPIGRAHRINVIELCPDAASVARRNPHCPISRSRHGGSNGPRAPAAGSRNRIQRPFSGGVTPTPGPQYPP